MFVTKSFVHKAEKVLKEGKENQIGIKKLMRQTKQISQIIAYIWFDGGDREVCNHLDECFKDINKLVELFNAKEGSPEYTWLKTVFKGQEHLLPIFCEEELKLYDFKLLIGQYEGVISDTEPGSDKFFSLGIPYPPSPRISDKPKPPEGPVAPIYREELEEWIQADSDKPPYHSDNPYIPTTCS